VQEVGLLFAKYIISTSILITKSQFICLIPIHCLNWDLLDLRGELRGWRCRRVAKSCGATSSGLNLSLFQFIGL